MAASGGWLVVAIHDVAPSLAKEVQYLLGALDDVGARPRVLKVIPNENGCGDVRDDPAFARMLAAEAAAGSEVVLHGYTHHVAGPLRGPWITHVRGRLFGGTAPEFLTLDRSQMTERVSAGQQALWGIGLEPHGFCAPCWLATPELPGVLRQCGIRYYTTMHALVDIGTGRRLWTPWLGYMGAGMIQERLIGVQGQLCAAMAPYAPIVKVFLHPQGALTSPACDRIVRTLARLVRDRRLVTYGGLLAR